MTDHHAEPDAFSTSLLFHCFIQDDIEEDLVEKNVLDMARR